MKVGGGAEHCYIVVVFFFFLESGGRKERGDPVSGAGSVKKDTPTVQEIVKKQQPPLKLF